MIKNVKIYDIEESFKASKYPMAVDTDKVNGDITTTIMCLAKSGKGEGQGSCKRCNDKGIWNRHWMSMLYEIKGYDGCYCWDCAIEIVKEGWIDE